MAMPYAPVTKNLWLLERKVVTRFGNKHASQTLTERVQIAELWRMQSKMQNSNKPENIMDVTPEAVTQVIANKSNIPYYMVIRIAP
jgi:hypothetical protein